MKYIILSPLSILDSLTWTKKKNLHQQIVEETNSYQIEREILQTILRPF